MISRAMILAAGTGSRLKPLTDIKPKALLTFKGKTMLEHVINQIVSNGITEVIINIHHHADQIVDFVKQNNSFGLNILFSDERDLLMDTGGAIIKARKYLDKNEAFLVHNIDIFSNIDLAKLVDIHLSKGALATLAVKDRTSSRKLLIDSTQRLCGWKNVQTGETIIKNEMPDLKPVAFSGIHIIDQKFFNIYNREEPFSMIKAYLDLAKQHVIRTYDHSDDTWIDMAHPDNFSELKKS